MPAIVQGKNALLSIYKIDGYYPFACIQEFTVNQEIDMVASTTVGSGSYRKRKPGLRDWSVSVSGLKINRDQAATRWMPHELWTDAIINGGLQILITYTDDDNYSRSIAGNVLINANSFSASAGQITKFSTEWPGNGALTIDGVQQGGALPALGSTVLTATAISESQIDLEWDAVVGAGNYELMRSPVNDIAFGSLIYIGTGLDFSNINLPYPSTPYHYWVRAAATSTKSAGPWAYATATTLSSGTGTPLLLATISFSDITSSQMRAAVPANADATSIEFRMNPDNSDFATSTVVQNTTALNYLATGLQAAKTHYWWARYRGNGTTFLDGPWTNAHQATLPAGPQTEFDTILTYVSSTYDSENGVGATSPNTGAVRQFHFDSIPHPRTGSFIVMHLMIGISIVLTVTFQEEYRDKPFKYIHATGTVYYGKFKSGLNPL